MSSLRIESLRLVWLEAFLKVSETENISATARELGVDQSTVSRYLIALQDWLGRDLIEISKIKDDEDAGRNVALTPDGAAFIEKAEKAVAALVSFRTEKARRTEVLKSMDFMIGKMLADLNSKKPSRTVQAVEEKVVFQAEALAKFRTFEHDDESKPLWDFVEANAALLRRFFATYEDQLKRERKAARGKAKRTSAAHIDMSRYRKTPPAT